MKLSGFTFLRNTSKLYYPILESIQSALPIVDEFVVALGKGDDDDDTEKKLRSLESEKLKIIHTVWDTEKYPRGMEYAHQTDIAKQACSGDWLLYLQGDEVIHENDYQEIVSKCNRYLNDKRVDGFLFDYYHFTEIMVIISVIIVGIHMKLELFEMMLNYILLKMRSLFVVFPILMVLAIAKKRELPSLMLSS